MKFQLSGNEVKGKLEIKICCLSLFPLQAR